MPSLLFVGNSYTYYNDMPRMLADLAKENGRELTVDSVTQGGRKLLAYENPDDPYTKELTLRLSEGSYDIAILQEQSLLPILDREAFRRGVEHLLGRYLSSVPRILLYETWARTEGHAALAEHGWSVSRMGEALRDAYRTVGESVGAEISPVGRAFEAFRAAYPALELYASDLTHPSPLGSALAAAVHYKTVFGETPCRLVSLGLSETETEAVSLITAGCWS